MTVPAKHCIFWNEPIDLRSGGPRGYLAHLRAGLDELPPDPDLSIWLDRVPAHRPPSAGGPRTEADLVQHIAFFENLENFDLGDSEFHRMMRGGTRSVHVHNTPLAFIVHQAMRNRGVTGIPLMVTSHCPESNGIEMADQYRVLGMPAALTDRFERAVRFVEELGFRAADIWLFPSPEAMDPYRETIPDFDRWAEGKDIRFVATGAVPPRVMPGASKSSFGLDGYQVVSFIGRHNRVKGYDIFRDAALALLERRPDVAVLVAGPPSPDMPAPRHERWHELGWHDSPGDVLAASDVFVLPNRRTFYDLVLIEALAMGTPTIASATGGNISVHRDTGGAIRLFDGSVDDLSACLNEALGSGERQLNPVRAYERLFTPACFASRYRDAIRSLHEDWIGRSGSSPA